MNAADDDWTSGKRARICGDKHPYSTRSEAKRERKRASQHFREARSRWRAYRCRYCNHFHIGHKMENPVQLDTIPDALAYAREKYPRVSIPETVDPPAEELCVHDPQAQRRWAQRITDALKALDAYAKAKQRPERPFSGNFYTFCQSSGASAVPIGAIQLTESPFLMQQPRLVEQRIFAVDPAVDPSGWMLMESHLRVQKSGNPAPRVYFYDDTRGATGRIHIGYVGKHLDNTHTAKSM
jgi:hypothetical protein